MPEAGPLRPVGFGDLFRGWGEAAAARARPMREAAEVFVLMPRERRDEDAEPGAAGAAAAILPEAPAGH